MSRKRKLEDSDEPENELNQLGTSDPHVVRYKIKRTRLEDEPQNAAKASPPESTPGEKAPTNDTKQPPSAQAEDSVKERKDEGSPAKPSESLTAQAQLITSSETTKEETVSESVPGEPQSLDSEEKKKDSAKTETIEPPRETPPDKSAAEETLAAQETPVERAGKKLKIEAPATAETSPKLPLFSLETLAPQANVLRTPFSSRGKDQSQEEAQTGESAEPSATSLAAGITVEKLGAFPQFAENAESPEKASTPSGSRPQSFPGEENEETLLADFNAVLLKCVNTSSQEEKPVFKYRQAGTGVIRVLKERDSNSRRVVFRQSGTWQVYLNSPLDLVGRVESVDQSTYFAVKFTALDAIASTKEKPKLAPFCVKLPDCANRNRLVSLLTGAE